MDQKTRWCVYSNHGVVGDAAIDRCEFVDELDGQICGACRPLYEAEQERKSQRRLRNLPSRRGLIDYDKLLKRIQQENLRRRQRDAEPDDPVG